MRIIYHYLLIGFFVLIAFACFSGAIVLFLVPLAPTILFFAGVSFLLAGIPSLRKIIIFKKIESSKKLIKKRVIKSSKMGRKISRKGFALGERLLAEESKEFDSDID